MPQRPPIDPALAQTPEGASLLRAHDRLVALRAEAVALDAELARLRPQISTIPSLHTRLAETATLLQTLLR